MNYVFFLSKRNIFLVLCLLAAGLFYWANANKRVSPVPTAEGLILPPMKTASMAGIFLENGYNMADFILDQKPIPRLFAQSVPDDFNRSKYDESRPALFTEMMMPVILKANQDVEKERSFLLHMQEIFEKEGQLSPENEAKVRETAKRYDVEAETNELSTIFLHLIPRVDRIPPTLLLSMSAEATGWATNRYARQHNALFMQKDWDGKGVLPEEEQEDGSQYRIKTFPTLYDSVASYIHYLNTGGYFDNFRIARAAYRRLKKVPDGYLTAGMLLNFPDKPFKYPDILKHLIKQYNWFLLDLQKLQPLETL